MSDKPYTKAQERDLAILRKASGPVSPWELAASSVARFKKEGIIVAVKVGTATMYVLASKNGRMSTS